MANAFEYDYENSTGKVDLSRLPAVIDWTLPPASVRRSLVAAAIGACALILTTILVLYIDGGMAGVERWAGNAVYGAAFASGGVGAAALLFILNELGHGTRRHRVTIGDGYVEIIRWPLIGPRRLNRLPLGDYTGVMKVAEDHGKIGLRYSIGIQHKKPKFRIWLYSSDTPDGWNEKWREYAERLRLPAIEEGHRPKETTVGGTPAIRVLPGNVFTLNLDVLPAAVAHESEPWSRLSGVVAGSMFGGAFVALLWAGSPRIWQVSHDWRDIVVMATFAGLPLWCFWMAIRAHLARWTYVIDRGRIARTRRGLFGNERWVEPISAFRGVARKACKQGLLRKGRSEREMRYSVVLIHPDRQRSMTLHRASYEYDIPARLRYYSERLGVPVLENEPQSSSNLFRRVRSWGRVFPFGE